MMERKEERGLDMTRLPATDADSTGKILRICINKAFLD